MVSFTAFRSLFVSTGQEAATKKARPWYSSQARKLMGAKKERLRNGGHEKLPSITDVTITGIRTFIRGSRGVSTIDSEAGQELRDQDHIAVTNVFSSELQEVCEAIISNFIATDE